MVVAKAEVNVANLFRYVVDAPEWEAKLHLLLLCYLWSHVETRTNHAICTAPSNLGEALLGLSFVVAWITATTTFTCVDVT
jgi:hypothetical protein